MITGSADKSTWQEAFVDRIVALRIMLARRNFVVPWSQFLYAEGDEEEVRLAFSTHDVIVSGFGLGALLAQVSEQRLAALREPARADAFTTSAGPQIRAISVRKVE
jgi:hypothetical protein